MEDAATLVPDEGTTADDAQVDTGAENSAIPADALTADQLRDELAANNESLTDSVTESVLAGIDQRDAESSDTEPNVQVVTLSDEQYQYIQNSYKLANTSSTFNLLVTCAILGALLYGYFVQGVRRG